MKKWFKFYLIYGEAFKELNSWRCKKLILALCEYAQYGFLTIKLDKKTNDYFQKIKEIYNADLVKHQVDGLKGAKKRWKYSQNSYPIRKNSYPISQK